MSKQEFTDGLRRSLSTIQDYTYVNDTISYYENYIEAQIRMGKTEEEVMQNLVKKKRRLIQSEEEKLH